MSGYMMFNPYQHMTEPFRLTVAQWGRVLARLTQADLANIDNGGWARVGAASVWKVGAR